jgi:hypothetical protein
MPQYAINRTKQRAKVSAPGASGCVVGDVHRATRWKGNSAT